MSSGYTCSIFGGQPPELKYVCNFCSQILKNPIQTFCGHRYCKECLEFFINSKGESGVLCKACNEEGNTDSILSIDQTYRDRAILRELNGCSVECPNEDCDWKGLYKEYDQEHEAGCPSARITCIKSGCGIRIKRDNLAEHLANECSMRVVRCQYCEAEFPHKELQVHYDDCTEFPVKCQFCEKDNIVRGKLAAHLDTETGDCPKKRTVCPFKPVGCQELVEEEKKNEHTKHSMGDHLLMVMNTMMTLLASVQTTKVDNEVDDVKRKVNHHDEKIEALTRENKNLESDIHALQEKVKKTAVVENGLTLNGLKGSLEKFQATFDSLGNKQTVLQTKLSTYEGIVAVLNKQIEDDEERIRELERSKRDDSEKLQALECKIKAQDRIIAVKDVALAEKDMRIQSLEMASYDGVLLWKISDFARKRQEAISGRTVSIYSPCFYTSRHGYKMCARIYLNGDGMGKGNHVSLFFVVMKGQYDALLRWPFRQKVTLMWLDQNNREHVIDAFRPDPTSSSFRRPTQDMNIASGCPLFMPLSQVESPRHAYVKDDVAFLKVVVDTSDLV
ncbi:TNF receptor-associated factor 2-like [Ptychodera flava]|uniref:TNF receptor-associated factor 2-like n=1 Tax=Ptychodera flava TaxID=63121 RepID=UPI003969EF48